MASIVVYDSGVGGLTVYQEIVKHCPGHTIIFVSDNDAFPYGTKTEEALISRVLKVTRRIKAVFSPDVLVVACNTASTVVLPFLRERFSFDVVGVVPAIKPAAQISRTGHICLLATPGTITRFYTDDLIKRFASNCVVHKIGSSDLVELAESKLLGNTPDLNVLKPIIKPIVDDSLIDVLVLACTHFPLLSKEITEQLEINHRQVTLIDSAKAVALRVSALVEDGCATDRVLPSTARLAVFTKKVSHLSLLENLKGIGFTDVNYLDV